MLDSIKPFCYGDESWGTNYSTTFNLNSMTAAHGQQIVLDEAAHSKEEKDLPVKKDSFGILVSIDRGRGETPSLCYYRCLLSFHEASVLLP